MTALVPAGLVTVTSTVPVPAGAVAVMVLSLLTVNVAVAVPKCTAVALVKLVPPIVTWLPAGELTGSMLATTGACGGPAT